MKLINISDFPKYTAECLNDEYDSWEASLIANGYKSAEALHEDGNYWGTLINLSDEEYTWFVLRWS